MELFSSAWLATRPPWGAVLATLRTRDGHDLRAAAGQLLGLVRVGRRGGQPKILDEVEALDGVPAQASRVPGRVAGVEG